MITLSRLEKFDWITLSDSIVIVISLFNLLHCRNNNQTQVSIFHLSVFAKTENDGRTSTVGV